MCAATMRPRLPAPRISQISSSNPGESGQGPSIYLLYKVSIFTIQIPKNVPVTLVIKTLSPQSQYIYYTKSGKKKKKLCYSVVKSVYLLYKVTKMRTFENRGIKRDGFVRGWQLVI